jgi:hypothetical protein
MAIKEKIEASFVTIASFLWLVHITMVENYGGNPRIHQIYLTVISFVSKLKVCLHLVNEDCEDDE